MEEVLFQEVVSSEVAYEEERKMVEDQEDVSQEEDEALEEELTWVEAWVVAL